MENYLKIFAVICLHFFSFSSGSQCMDKLEEHSTPDTYMLQDPNLLLMVNYENQDIFSLSQPRYIVQNNCCHSKNNSSDILLGGIIPSTTSLYMTGNISIGIVFVNGKTSLGTDYTFNLDEKKKIMGKILDATNFLTNAEPLEDINFSYHIYTPSILADPGVIQDDDDLMDKYRYMEEPWRDAALLKMGYPGNFNGINAFVSDLKNKQNVDWAYAIFITKYPLAWGAYVNLSNQRVVIGPNYYNTKSKKKEEREELIRDWLGGIDGLDMTIAHETCHIFGASDEYIPPERPCNGLSGTNQVPDMNCDGCVFPGILTTQCLMKYNQPTLCNFTRGHLGWSWWTAPEYLTTSQAPLGGGLAAVAYNVNLYTFWVDRGKIYYASTVDTKNWDNGKTILQQKSGGSIAATIFNKDSNQLNRYLYVFWPDKKTHYITYASIGNQPDATWSPATTIPISKVAGTAERTSGNIATAVFKNNLYIFWVEHGTINYTLTADTTKWKEKCSIPEQNGIVEGAAGSIATSVFNDRLYAFWINNSYNTRCISYASTDGDKWVKPDDLLLPRLLPLPFPSQEVGRHIASAVFNNRLHVISSFLNGTRLLNYSSKDGNIWSLAYLNNNIYTTPILTIAGCIFNERLFVLLGENEPFNRIKYTSFGKKL